MHDYRRSLMSIDQFSKIFQNQKSLRSISQFRWSPNSVNSSLILSTSNPADNGSYACAIPFIRNSTGERFVQRWRKSGRKWDTDFFVLRSKIESEKKINKQSLPVDPPGANSSVVSNELIFNPFVDNIFVTLLTIPGLSAPSRVSIPLYPIV